MDENQKVKLEFIEAYLNNAEAKLLFLSELAETGHRDEAMTLCLVYIDRFAQVLKWPSTESGKNFVEALIIRTRSVYGTIPSTTSDSCFLTI